MGVRLLVGIVAFALAGSVCAMLAEPAQAQPELVSTTGAGSANTSSTIQVTTFWRRQQSSADGRFIVFQSRATDLIPGFVNGNGGAPDIFVRDHMLDSTTLVSINANATASGNGASTAPAISADGRFVAFVSEATDLVMGVSDTNGSSDVFVRDLMTNTTHLASANVAGTATGNAASDNPLFSPDGTSVAFVSSASDLVGVPTAAPNLFLRDVMAGETTLVSVNAAGTAGGDSETLSAAGFSADGNRILFTSNASDLTGNSDTNGTTDVFVRDLPAGPTTLVSVTTAGTAPTGLNDISSLSPGGISADGNLVVFSTFANTFDLTGVLEGNGTSVSDVILRDLAAGTSSLVSINVSGTSGGNRVSDFPTISANGRSVAFTSEALNLEGLSKIQLGRDVYVRDLMTNTTALVSPNSDGTFGGNGPSTGAILSLDGSRVVFASAATDLVDAGFSDTNGVADIFVRDLATDTTTAVSINSAGTATGNGANFGSGISNDGSVVVFVSSATDLTVLPDNNGAQGDVFAFDLGLPPTTTTTVVSTTTTSTTTTSLPGGICGDPVEPGAALVSRVDVTSINATDALFTLKAGVGSEVCELCVCDVNDSGDINASDALGVLQFAVGQPIVLTCPSCAGGG